MAFTQKGKRNNAFETLHTAEENLTQPQLTNHIQQLFEASTNNDDTDHKWHNIRQTAGGHPACIPKMA